MRVGQVIGIPQACRRRQATAFEGCRMSTRELGSLALALLLLVLGANVLGQLFARFRQPKVVGEILAGVLLGPSLLGHLAPGTTAGLFGDGPKAPAAIVLGFLYHLGLLLLMFISGTSVRHVLGKEKPQADRLHPGHRDAAAVLPGPVRGPDAALEHVMGSAGSKPAVVLVFAIAAAVTSIPVITKIFYDLGIRQRFTVPLEALNQVAAAVFIPIYFAIVGYRLDFTKSFSPCCWSAS
jgi:Kef-type K+ transport system membrane component KefB